ncbi:MAG: hypothetical protein V4550_08185 [Gemmatimonadota bacterium]
MPLAGFVCPPGGESPGRQNKIEYCLEGCKHPCVTAPLLGALWQADQDNYHKTDYISASMIAGTNCMRQTVLERFEPYYELPQKKFWPFRGTLAHRLCEDAAGFIDKFGWIQELKMSATLQYPDHPAPVFAARVLEDGQTVQEFMGNGTVRGVSR